MMETRGREEEGEEGRERKGAREEEEWVGGRERREAETKKKQLTKVADAQHCLSRW